MSHLIEKTFGPAKRSAPNPNWDPLIFVRHGFMSNLKPFVDFSAEIKKTFPAAIVDNRTYDWKQTVFRSGVELAVQVVSHPDFAQNRQIIFIGHSMGGLVSRVANAILTDLNFRNSISALALKLGYYKHDIGYFDTVVNDGSFPLVKIHGLVTLATPNCGAMLHGQVSNFAAITKGFGVALVPSRVSSIADLTTSRLFKLLEAAASDTPVLTISGSFLNRFVVGSGQLARLTAWAGVVMDFPNDKIVEDRSVNLSLSILANELTHNGDAKHLHLRAYRNCDEVHHTNIYDHATVRAQVIEFLRML